MDGEPRLLTHLVGAGLDVGQGLGKVQAQVLGLALKKAAREKSEERELERGREKA
jgi:hypothetical protein